MKTSVFTSGRSQAVRIPKDLRINAKCVEIEGKGETLVLRPLPEENSWPEGFWSPPPPVKWTKVSCAPPRVDMGT